MTVGDRPGTATARSAQPTGVAAPAAGTRRDASAPAGSGGTGGAGPTDRRDGPSGFAAAHAPEIMGAAAALGAGFGFVIVDRYLLGEVVTGAGGFVLHALAAGLAILAAVAVYAGRTRAVLAQLRTASGRVRTFETAAAIRADLSGEVVYRYRFRPRPEFEFMSSSSTRITGYSPQDHYADPGLWLSLVVPEDRHLVERLGEGTYDPTRVTVVRWRRRDGTVIWTEQRNRPVVDARGEVVGVECVAHDISSRKRALDETARLRRVLNDAFEKVIMLDQRTYAVIDANPGAALALRCERSELLSMTARDIFPEVEATRFMVVARAAIETHQAQSPVELEIRRADASRFNGLVRVTCVPDADHPVIVAFFEDLTDRKSATADLARLATAVEESDDLIVIADRARSIVYVNPAFERATGFSREQVLGHRPEILGSTDDPATDEQIWKGLRAGTRWSGVTRMPRADGAVLHTLTTITPVKDAAGQVEHFVGVQRDLSREQALRDELEMSRRSQMERAVAAQRVATAGTLPESCAAILAEVHRRAPGIPACIIAFPANHHPELVHGSAIFTRIGSGSSLSSGWVSPGPTHATSGTPWSVEVPRLGTDEIGRMATQAGVTAFGVVPIRRGPRVVGALATGNRVRPGPNGETGLDLTSLLELGAFGSAVLGVGLDEWCQRSEGRHRVETVIAGRLFEPVFQPIVNLAGGDPIGWEALTRFADGTSPRELFDLARKVGLSARLELATLQAAVEVAFEVEINGWIGLNMSIETAQLEETEAALYATGLPLVVELDAPDGGSAADVGARLAPLAPLVRIALNDPWHLASGISDLLSLRPAYVKVRVPLLRLAKDDPFGRALLMTTGLILERAGAQLIAVGIETLDDIALARSFGMDLGQGHFLGKPAPLRNVAVARRPPAA